MTRCPNCKEPVSQFAAGCSICGTDLEAARRTRAAKRRLPSPNVPSVPQDVLIAAILSLIVLVSPLFGIILCLLMINRENGSHQQVLRFVLWGLVALGLAFLLLPQTRYAGLLSLLYG